MLLAANPRLPRADKKRSQSQPALSAPNTSPHVFWNTLHNDRERERETCERTLIRVVWAGRANPITKGAGSRAQQAQRLVQTGGVLGVLMGNACLADFFFGEL